MYKRTKSWYKQLSKAGRVGVIGAGIFSLLAVNSVMAGPGDKPKPPSPGLSCEATTEVVTETVPVPFEKTQVEDASLEKGKTVVTTTGANGEKTVTKEVTDYSPSGCKPSETKFGKEEVTKQPVTEVTSIGTKVPQSPTPPQPNCHPSYSPCVPNVSYDLDCADIGMSVSVRGSDPYRLDRDGDGAGCESY